MRTGLVVWCVWLLYYCCCFIKFSCCCLPAAELSWGLSVSSLTVSGGGSGVSCTLTVLCTVQQRERERVIICHYDHHITPSDQQSGNTTIPSVHTSHIAQCQVQLCLLTAITTSRSSDMIENWIMRRVIILIVLFTRTFIDNYNKDNIFWNIVMVLPCNIYQPYVL